MRMDKTELPNGLRFLTIPVKASFSATIMVLVSAGSRYETSKNSGIAHFVEHMMFKGTEKRPSSKIIGMDIETIGGSSNAFTSYDYTGYYIKVPAEQIHNASEIMADMIKNGLFEEKEIEKERGVIIEEIRMYEDRPMSKVSSIWFDKFFGDTPLGRDIAGSVETVSKIKREDFQKFRNTFYHGKDLVVVLAGNLDSIDPKMMVEELFGDISIGHESSFEVYSKEERQKEIFQIKKSIEQSHLMIGGYGHNRNYKDKYKFKVADAILSEGFGSKLFQVIRDELGVAYYVYSSLTGLNDIGVYRIGLGVENSKIEIAVKAVIEEIRKLIEGKFDDDDLIRAKNYLLGNLVTDLESSDEIAIWFGIQELLLNKTLSVEEVKKEIMSVTKEDIISVSNDVFANQNLLMTAVTPEVEIKDGLSENLYL